MPESEFGRNRVALRKQIGGVDGGPGARCERGQQDADRPLADDQHCLVRLKIEHLHALEAGIHRLDEGGLVERDPIGNPDDAAVADDPVHYADVFGESAAGGFESSRDAYAFVQRTLRVGVLAAVVTIPARHMVEDHHPITDGKVSHRRAGGDDGTCRFMAKNSRRRVRTRMNLLQIRPANAARGNPDQDFPRADLRHRNCFYTYIVNAAIHRRAHGCRNCLELRAHLRAARNRLRNAHSLCFPRSSI